ncbi:MAG: endonuclease [Bacilli bacterium]|nr:endonuclease [Bacilli bacterium]
MKTKLSLVLASLAMAFSVGAGVASTKINNSVKPVEASAESYWSGTSGTGKTLFDKLYAKIANNVTTIDYDNLWEAYKKTDQVPGTSKIWDMYGGFQFTYQSGGKSYGSEGDCYNREHSVPKSWWGKTVDARYSDIIHLVPTDGYVNNRRGNYAFGEVSSATYSYSFSQKTDGSGNIIQTAGISKLGTGKSIGGITAPSTVFEPDDQYKGDFARIYYYFATRYGPASKIATEGDGAKMFSSNASDFYMTAYGKALMNKWHVQDPVSEKEISRNNGVETTQGNRNPYVDHPEWADSIFGSNYEETHGSTDTPSLIISATATSLDAGDTATLTANLENITGTVNWYVEDSSTDVITLSSSTGNSITVTGVGNGTKTVWAHIGSVSDSVEITVGGSGGTTGDGTILFGSADGRTNINAASITGDDSLGNTWTITTVGTTSFTPSSAYSQIGSSNKPATSITFSMTLDQSATVTSFVASFGGFSSTAGTISLKVGNTEVGSGSLNAANDVTVTATNTTTVGTVLTVAVTGISKGVKAYSINYSTSSSSSEPTLSSISVKTSPTKLSYQVGEYFSPTGLVITRTYSDSSTSDYAYAGHATEFSFNPSLTTQLAEENDSVEIFYENCSIEIAISVVDTSKTLVSISVSGMTTSYSVGDAFSFDGVCTATYSSGDPATVTPTSVSSPDMSSAGTKNVTVSYTFNNVTKTASYSITVSQPSTVDVTFVAGTDTGKHTGATGDQGEDSVVKKTVTMATSNGALAASGQYRVYQNATLTFSSSSTITKIILQGTSSKPVSELSTTTGTFTYDSASYSGTWTGNTNEIVFTAGAQVRFSSATVTLLSSGTKTLESISLNTENVKKTFNVNDDFIYSGLVVTAHYSDASSQEIESGYTVSSPSMSSAGEKTVIVTYNSKTADYSITVLAIPTSITASLKETRVFAVGETITKDDIKVVTNTNVDVTSDVSFPDYMFVYADSNGGNTTKNKSFTITYSTLPSTSLTVQVKRTAYVAADPSTETWTRVDDISTLVAGDQVILTGTKSSVVYAASTYESGNNVPADTTNTLTVSGNTASGVVSTMVYTLETGNTNGTLSFKDSSGKYLYAASSSNNHMKTQANKDNNASFILNEDGSVVAQGTNTRNSMRYNNLNTSNMFSCYASGSTTGTQVTFFKKSGGSEETAKNVSNYIMYEDTNNQCNTKLDIVIGYLNNLTQDELDSFVEKTESQDYVIYTARTRLNAWAASKGKTINYSTAGHVVMNSYVNLITRAFEAGNATTIIIIIGIVGLTALGGYIFIRKRKEI